MTNKVFVYGTLKSGFYNSILLTSSKFVGKGYLIGNFRMLDLGAFPGVVKAPNSPESTVVGEVYEVSDSTLARLDALEGNGHFYKREVRTISVRHKNDTSCWVYFLMQDSGEEEVRKDGNFYIWTGR